MSSLLTCHSDSRLSSVTRSDDLEMSAVDRIDTRFSDASDASLVQKSAVKTQCSGPVENEKDIAGHQSVKTGFFGWIRR